MNAAHLHLALNHVPVLGVALGTLLLAYGLFGKKPQVLRASWGVLVACGLVALAVYFTGEGAEEIVEARRGVAEALVESHEEAGLLALISAMMLAVLAGLGLLVGRLKTATWFAGLVLCAALVTGGVMAWTANLGGQISHPEIRSNAVEQPPSAVERIDDDAYENEEDE